MDDWDEATNIDPMFRSSHIVNVNDITATFGGDTVGSLGDTSGSAFDTSGASGTKLTQAGVTPYPIDSEFGHSVSDFENAVQKSPDGDHAEGWAGNVLAGDQVIGLTISDSPTDTFRTPAVFCTSLAGLGLETVKADSAHDVVTQNVLSDRVNPGLDAARDGDHDDEGDIVPLRADGSAALDRLDNHLVIVGGAKAGRAVIDVIEELRALPDMAGDLDGDRVINIKDALLARQRAESGLADLGADDGAEGLTNAW